jgi:hypothetical protein
MQTDGRLWGRLFGFVFLAVVVGAVGLLIAGYGVPVGLGALAGLILGAVAGMLSALWLMRGFGRSVSFGGYDWSSEDTALRPSAEDMAAMHELAELSGIDLGPIRSIRPVLQTVEAGGRSVQLVAIEEHEAGLSMVFEVRTGPGVRPPGSMARVSLTDDAGTAYRAAGQGQGGWPGRMRYEVTATPALPPTATRLDVRVERFVDHFRRPAADDAGPWVFSVPLDRPA